MRQEVHRTEEQVQDILDSIYGITRYHVKLERNHLLNKDEYIFSEDGGLYSSCHILSPEMEKMSSKEFINQVIKLAVQQLENLNASIQGRRCG